MKFTSLAVAAALAFAAPALAQGADPNTIDEYGHTALAELAENDRWMYVTPKKGETEEDLKARFPPVSPAERIACMEVLHRAGAHLDLTGPNGLTLTKPREQVQGLHDKVLARTPAQRWGNPGDFAGVAVFLATAASDFVTGAAIAVDGGYSVQA